MSTKEDTNNNGTGQVSDSFEKGMNGEWVVFVLLRTLFYYIEKSGKAEEEGKTPKLHHIDEEREVVLPDLFVRDEDAYVEVKTRTRAAVCDITGEARHCIKQRLWDDYKEMEKLGYPVYIALYVENENKVLCERISNLDVVDELEGPEATDAYDEDVYFIRELDFTCQYDIEYRGERVWIGADAEIKRPI
jgi:hypothetical protein